jgi:hypothetical protein
MGKIKANERLGRMIILADDTKIDGNVNKLCSPAAIQTVEGG